MSYLEDALRIPKEWKHLPEVKLLDLIGLTGNKKFKPVEEAEVEFDDTPGEKERIFVIGREDIFLWYSPNIDSETGLVNEVVNAFNDQVKSYKIIRKI